MSLWKQLAAGAVSALAVLRLPHRRRPTPTPQARRARLPAKKPNILVIWGDDIGQFNISAYNNGMMGYRTPNIDSIAKEGALFTDWYGQQSCTAGRAAFVTGQSPIRTGLTKVGLPGAPEGMKAEDPTIATLLRAQGYVTGQFGKNHLGDRDEMLPIEPRLRRVLRQPLPPQRRGGAREPGLPEGPRVQEEVRAARRHPQLRRRPHHRHRPAHAQAHGDDRRGSHRQGPRLHDTRVEGRQAVLPLVELDPHARLHAPQGGVGGQDRPRHLRRRHGRARRPRGPGAREAQGAGPRREHHRHVLDRQRRRDVHVARWRHDDVPRREEHELGGRLPRPHRDPLARRHQARHGDQRDRRARGHAARRWSPRRATRRRRPTC